MTRSHVHGHWDALVFFGATGDPAYKQIFPAPVALVAGQRHRVARGRAA
jgi:glucose-6-phosphate 1-dehydrogenase